MLRSVIISFLFCAISCYAFGQEISGTIVDGNSNEPLIGATIQVEGESGGTATDIDGKFSISSPRNNGNLLISYTGYSDQTVSFSSSSDDIMIRLESDATQLKEVIVSARRTAKAAHKTSLSITTFDAKDIQALGLTDPTSLADFTPGFYSKPTVGNSNPVYTVRGVGFNDFTSIQNPGTAVYINDVIVPYHTMMSFQLMDVERVEVLKGPQGTLYGRNSTAGAINIYTKKYGESMNGTARLDLGSWNTIDLEAAVGGPISETLSFRGSISSYNMLGGYQTNRLNDDDSYGSTKRTSGRLRLNWNASDNVDISFDIHGGVDNSDPVALQHIGTIDPGTGAEPCGPVAQGMVAEGPCTNAAGYFDDDDDPYTGDYSVTVGGLDNDALGLNLRAEIKLGNGATLTSITGMENFNRNQLQDIDAGPARFLDVTFTDETRSLSQEIRLASDQESDLSYVVGAFYSKDKVDALQSIDATDLVMTMANVTNDQETSSLAAFAHTEYALGKLNILGGLRYSSENKDWTGGSDFVGVAAITNTASIEDTDLSGLIGLEYFLKDDVMVYANYSSAYRSGGFPGGFTLNPEGLKPFTKEKVLATEIGLKMKSADGKFSGNLAYYHYNWKDFQTQFSIVDATTGLPSLILTNAGDAIIDGVEASFNYLANENFLISAGLNAMDGNIEESDDARLEGKALPNAPDLTFNAMLRIKIPTGGSHIIVQPDIRYTGQRYFTSNNEPVFQDDGYTLLNARISYPIPNSQHEIGLWAKNIGNTVYRTEGFNQFGFSGDSYFAIGRPRAFGVSLNFKFL